MYVMPANGYEDRQAEIATGNVLIQNHFYSTTPEQFLFHRQTATAADTEAFFISGFPGGVNLWQTTASAITADSIGFYEADHIFRTFRNPTWDSFGGPIGYGFRPLCTGAPMWAGLSFPYMYKIATPRDFDVDIPPPPPPAPGPEIEIEGEEGEVVEDEGLDLLVDKPGGIPGINEPVKNRNENLRAENVTQNIKQLVSLGDNQTNDTFIIPARQNRTDVAEEILQQDLWEEEREVPKSEIAQELEEVEAEEELEEEFEEEVAQEIAEEPAEEAAEEAVEEEAEEEYEFIDISPMTSPFGHQINKPFSYTMSPVISYKTTNRDDIAQMTGWERFMVNMMGRSFVDKTYHGTTSGPVYINPSKLVLYDQFETIQEHALPMTLPGTTLHPRWWCL